MTKRQEILFTTDKLQDMQVKSILMKIFFITSLALVSCRPDGSADKQGEASIDANSDETNQVADFENAEDTDWRDTVVVDYTTPKIVEEVAITEKKDLKAETKALVDQSFNTGKSCEEILQSYEVFMKKASANLTTELIAELSKWAKDPLYNDCYSRDKDFRTKADKLDELLD